MRDKILDYIFGISILIFCFYYKHANNNIQKLNNKIKEQEYIIHENNITNNKLTLKNKVLEDIISENNIIDLKKKNQELEDIISKNNISNKILEKKNQKLEDIISKNNISNKILAQKNQELEDIIKKTNIIELKKKNKELEDLANKTNIINNKLTKKNKELEDIINKNNRNNNDLTKKNQELEDMVNKNNNNYNELRKQIKEQENIINISKDYKKIEYNPEFIGKKLEMFYDLIINIRSIRELSEKDKGWKIKWNKNINSTKEFIKDNKKLLKAGILGNGNIGKSFLLSRIFKEKIPSGFSVITEGLSIKINKERFVALLDSAGLQTPLLKNEEIKNDENEYELLYKDKSQTENFIQNLIMHFSDMLLIVVGKLTFNEQRLINKIKKELENQNSKKPIFIIHNLMNFHTIAQVEDHVNNTLLKSASFKLERVRDIKKSVKNEERYYLIENEKDFFIYHLIMAREMTEAGDYYNNYLYEFLEERFNEFPDRNSFYILDEIRNKFAEWSSEILEDPIKLENIKIKMENNVEKRIVYEAINNENIIPKIIPKACLSNEIGTIFYRSSGYEPPYYYYVEEKKYLVIVLEFPGIVEIEEVYADIDQNKVFIKGNKIDFLKKKINSTDNGIKLKEIKIKKNTMKFGKFNLVISYENEIKLSDETPIDDEEIPMGIRIFKFILARRRENKKNK